MNTDFLLMLVNHTPVWVWALLAVLTALGLQQSRDRWVSAQRLKRVPMAFLGLSAWSTVSAFGWQPLMLAGFGLAFAFTIRLVQASGWPGAAHFDAERQAFQVAGSWVPLALMLSMFGFKYALGVGLAMAPQLQGIDSVVLGVSALNGALAAVFLGRARNLVKRPQATAAAAC